MSTYEIIDNVFAGLAVIISIVAYQKATKSEQAAVEISINERLTETRNRVSDIVRDMSPLLFKQNKTAEEKAVLEVLEKTFNEAVESNLNVYDTGCGLYIDKKIDRERFKKNYSVEIRQLVEKAEYKKHFDPHTTRYRKILILYNEWNNLEG